MKTNLMDYHFNCQSRPHRLAVIDCHLTDHAKRAFESNWSSTMDQMLLAVAGEGGMGKTRVIKAVELGFELLQWKVLPLHGYITALGRNRYRPTFLVRGR